jgi:hypothetical protein
MRLLHDVMYDEPIWTFDHLVELDRVPLPALAQAT